MLFNRGGSIGHVVGRRFALGSTAGVFEDRVMLVGGVNMQAPSWIISGLFVLLCTAAALSANEPPVKPGILERIQVQQARLAEIEKMAAQERAQVEQSCARRRDALVEEKARQTAATLSLPLRSLWTEFWKMHRNQPYAPGYFDGSYYDFPFSSRAAVLRYTMTQEYFVSEMASLLLDEEFQRKLTQIVNERWQNPPLRYEAAELLTLIKRLHAELTMDLQQLENQKTTALDALSQKERDLQEQVRSILAYLRDSEGQTTILGVVESIAYGPQGGYVCMIEGIDEVLRPGDTVKSIQILSIDPEKVEFSKNGTRWTQMLGAPAYPHWD